jgi:hypothetical protein
MANPLDPNKLTCPNCTHPMRVAHIVPKQAGLPELKSFRCFFCNQVTTKAAEAE